jgi:hypothetical protein
MKQSSYLPGYWHHLSLKLFISHFLMKQEADSGLFVGSVPNEIMDELMETKSIINSRDIV